MKNKDTQKRRKEDKSTCTLMIWNVPKRLKKRFKAACQKRDITMRQAVIDMLKWFTNA